MEDLCVKSDWETGLMLTIIGFILMLSGCCNVLCIKQLLK